MRRIFFLFFIVITFGCSDTLCGTRIVSGEQKTLTLGPNGGCYYVNKNGNKSYVDKSECNCDDLINIDDSNNKRSSVIIQKGVYEVSYNEIYEQPNWVKYTVSNRPKNVDRGSMDFHNESGVYTSNDADYSNNPWDKGHLAPAASFSDTYDNLYSTFSYVNCAMQIDNLNRGEWAELEQQVRDWSTTGSINVEVELIFGNEVRSTGVRLPTGFWKRLTFSDGTKKCFYFPNSNTNKNWDQYQANCN